MAKRQEESPSRQGHGKRPYRSSRRQAQAAETRRHILEAARALFDARGYAGTTVEAIARQAGVAAETIYASFGSKRAVLTRLVDISVLGDEQPESLLERPGPQAVVREADQGRQVRMFAGQIREIMGRVSPLFEIMGTAAKTEPEVALLLGKVLEGRRQGMMHFVAALSANGPLRAQLSREQAADTVWALTSAEVYHLFTADRRWPPERYEAWLAATLEAALLP